MVVIDAAAGYVPLYRIDREEIAAQHGGNGRGESAVPARDENHITMASEAAETAIERSNVDTDDVAAVFSASVSDHFAEHGIAAQLAYRLGTPDDIRTGDFQATVRAAADAVETARQYVRATDGPVLVVAADIMPVEPGDDDETVMGAGAGALVLRARSDDPVATIDSVGQATTGFLERHRKHGQAANRGDSRFERRHGIEPATSAAVARTEIDADPDYAVVSAPGYRFVQTALEAVDADHVSTFNDVGFAGAATLLIDLTHAIESAEADTSAVAVVYGQGGADAFAVSIAGSDNTTGLSVAEQIDAKEYVCYSKHLEYRERHDYQGVPNP